MKNFDIEKLLYQQVDKPKNHFITKVINVYSDKYRINVYCENTKENDTIIQKSICASYFCRYKEKELQIISGSNYSKI